MGPRKNINSDLFYIDNQPLLRYVKFSIIEAKTACLKMIEINYLQEEILNGNNRV